MQNFRGVEAPYYGEVTCELRCPFLYMAELFQLKWYQKKKEKKKRIFGGSRNLLLGGATFEL